VESGEKGRKLNAVKERDDAVIMYIALRGYNRPNIQAKTIFFLYFLLWRR
jgi:hypothetical protein